MLSEFERIRRNLYFEPGTNFPFEFDGEHLFADFQDFHLPLARMQHAHEDDWGIVRGLGARGIIGGTEIIIEPGVAFDRFGQLITLSSEEGAKGDVRDSEEDDPVEVDVPVTLRTAGREAGSVYVTIQYGEIVQDEGAGGRPEVVPWLRLQAVDEYEDNGVFVILAIAEVSAGGVITQLKDRDDALPHGRRLAGKTVEELRIRRSIRVEEVDGDETRITIQENVPTGRIRPRAGGGLRITVPGNSDGVVFDREGGGTFGRLDVRADAVMLAGGVGIGTDAPAAGLHVVGDIRTDAGLQVSGPASLAGGAEASSLRVTGNINLEGNLSVAGAVDGRDISEDGAKLDTHVAGRDNPHEMTAAQVGALSLAGGNLAGALTVTGNVGIGTASPGAKLDVVGDIRADGIIRANSFRPLSNDWEIVRTGEHLEIREPEQANKVWARFEDDKSFHLIGTPNLWVDGDIGVGTTSPGASLHVSSGGNFRHPQLQVSQISNTDWARIVLNARNHEFHLAVGAPGVGIPTPNVLNIWSDTSKRNIVTVASVGRIGIMHENPGHPLHMGGGAFCEDGRRWRDASSLVYKKDVAPLALGEALEVLAGLNSVTFIYKEDAEDKRHVGFIAEEVPQLVTSTDRKGLSALDIVGILTKVVQHQQAQIDELKASLHQGTERRG